MKTDEKIDKIFDMVHAQNVEIAKFLVKHEKHEEVAKKVEKLESNQNKAIGGLALISAGFTYLFHWIKNH